MASEVPAISQILGVTSASTGGPDDSLPTTFVKHRVIESLRELYHNQQGRFHWDEDDTKSGLLISDVYALNHTEVEKKPSVIVRRGTTNWYNVAIDQFIEQHGQGASPVRADLLDCQVILYCTGRALEAEALADTTFLGLTFFRSIIRKGKDIHDIIPQGVGVEQLAKADSGVELSVVPVTVRFLFEKKWMIKRTGDQPFRGFNVEAVDP